MSVISGIDTGYSSALDSIGTKETAMGKDDFLMLMVAQLENQDPMNPQDSTEFTAQLAQFSSLEQLTNINTSLEGLATMSSEMERMSALGLIGQDVVANSEQFHFNGESAELGYHLESNAEDVKLYVLGETGATLATITPEETSSGDHFIDWIGLADAGMPLEPGNYSLVIKATDADDKLVTANSLIRGRVEAVDMSDVEAQIETNSGTFSMSKIAKAGAAL